MVNFLPSEIAQASLKIADISRLAGGRALLVGGCVRDAWMKKAAQEADIEVYGLDFEQLCSALSPYFHYDLVGQSFGVLKIKHLAIDVSLPRRESKIGLGHQAFHIQADPHLSFEEAALRRDFTMNAIGYDPLADIWLDPFHGRQDIERQYLRHVGQQFAEDPLRILRAMQFIARFELNVDPSTLMICRQIQPENLSVERIFGEWKKLLLLGQKPSLGLAFLKDSGWLQYTPELQALVNCPQDPVWHPEGDVWAHTGYALDYFAANRIQDEWEDLVVGFAVLCHDLGKPYTTQLNVNGRLSSPGHDEQGEPYARSFLNRLTQHKALIEAVCLLVRCHMRPMQLHQANASDSAIRRLAAKVERIDRLLRVVRADHAGRPPLPAHPCLVADWLWQRADALAITDQKPAPIILGRHLMSCGLKPSADFKRILDRAYEAQLDHLFEDQDGGLQFLRLEGLID